MNCKNYKIFSLLFLISASSVFAQTKEETDKIMRSQDPKEISAFVKKYPNNPNANFLSNRLKNLAPAQSPKAKPVIQPLNTEKLSKEVEKKVEKGKADANTERTVNLLNNLFSTDRNKSEVFVMIKNNSNCNLIVKVDGKTFFNLDVPKKGDNYLFYQKEHIKLLPKFVMPTINLQKILTEDTQIVLGIKKRQEINSCLFFYPVNLPISINFSCL
jgi:hypothetical protein